VSDLYIQNFLYIDGFNMRFTYLYVKTKMKCIVTIGTAVAQWLRYCATNQKVAGSIPDGVIDINSSDRTMALESSQPLTEMSTRSISWG
jgi:hypothetical protein